MKKILLGTTALVLLSGAAAAQQVSTKSPFTVSLNGSMRYNFAIFDQDASGVNRESSIDSRILLKAEAKADNGLTYGYRARLRSGANTGGNAGAVGIDQSAIYASGSWGAVYLGDDSDARTQLEVLNPTVGIGQADQVGFLLAGNNSMYWSTEGNWSTKATYMTPSFSGFQAGVSYTPENDNDQTRSVAAPGAAAGDYADWFDIGAGYTGSFGAVGLKVGAGIGFGAVDRGVDTDDAWNWNLGAQVSYAGFTFGGFYWDDNNTASVNTGRGGDDRTSWGLGLTYATGPWGVGASFVRTNVDYAAGGDDTDQVIGVGGAYQLAPGLSLQGDILHVDAQSNNNDGWGISLRTRVDF
ncbi:porin [Lacibacterium aquatile]|uniref:Porin n=1 Tax=Lacibacterium aquatile TaxID=1168082 RepID=A0ABW5DR86_9PROT